MISTALIHPMLVHFPIVLLITAVAMDIFLLLTNKDLANRKCLPLMALSALLLLSSFSLVVLIQLCCSNLSIITLGLFTPFLDMLQ